MLRIFCIGVAFLSSAAVWADDGIKMNLNSSSATMEMTLDNPYDEVAKDLIDHPEKLIGLFPELRQFQAISGEWIKKTKTQSVKNFIAEFAQPKTFPKVVFQISRTLEKCEKKPDVKGAKGSSTSGVRGLAANDPFGTAGLSQPPIRRPVAPPCTPYVNFELVGPVYHYGDIWQDEVYYPKQLNKQFSVRIKLRKKSASQTTMSSTLSITNRGYLGYLQQLSRKRLIKTVPTEKEIKLGFLLRSEIAFKTFLKSI